MELWIWILLGVIGLAVLSAVALLIMTFLVFSYVVSGSLEKEDSDFR